ncbi:MAG: NERD domain-containing protein [Chromatiales bacterium]|nr:NERD domain-containing protein [Chromatiales bacterium]
MSRPIRSPALVVVGAGLWATADFLGAVDGALSGIRSFAASAPEVTAFVALLVAFATGFLLGRHRTRFFRTDVFQNRGEARLSRALIGRFGPPDYHLLNHVTLRVDDGTTQVDHVLVSRFGVFVIETKDYRGWIFGSPDSRQWTQVLYRAKFRFQNPIHQNQRHVLAVRALLDLLPAEAVRPVVVFTGTAEFKTAMPDGVFSLEGFLSYVESQTVEVMSANRVQFCVGRLETARLSVTKETDIEHVQRLRRRYGSDE